jgi:hypothetical protein
MDWVLNSAILDFSIVAPIVPTRHGNRAAVTDGVNLMRPRFDLMTSGTIRHGQEDDALVRARD